jgi:hypothetical protein
MCLYGWMTLSYVEVSFKYNWIEMCVDILLNA